MELKTGRQHLLFHVWGLTSWGVIWVPAVSISAYIDLPFNSYKIILSTGTAYISKSFLIVDIGVFLAFSLCVTTVHASINASLGPPALEKLTY